MVDWLAGWLAQSPHTAYNGHGHKELSSSHSIHFTFSTRRSDNAKHADGMTLYWWHAWPHILYLFFFVSFLSSLFFYSSPLYLYSSLCITLHTYNVRMFVDCGGDSGGWTSSEKQNKAQWAGIQHQLCHAVSLVFADVNRQNGMPVSSASPRFVFNFIQK